MDVAGDSGAGGGVDHVFGSLGVDFFKGLALGLSDDADEVDGAGAAGDGGSDGGGIGYRAGECDNAFLLREFLGVSDETMDFVAPTVEFAQYVGADKASGTREEDRGGWFHHGDSSAFCGGSRV